MSTNTEPDLSLLEPVLEHYQGSGRTQVLPALHAAQRIYNYLPLEVVKAIGQALRVPLADLHGVIEFYTRF